MITGLRSGEELLRLSMENEAQADRYRRHIASLAPESPTEGATGYGVAPPPQLKPLSLSEGGNVLRPRLLSDLIGQEKLKPLLRRLIDNAQMLHRPLDHLLLVGASGTGKTTLAVVIANEIGTRVFALKAPIDQGTLLALREQANERDVVFVDEIHMMVSGDRRGITQACDPESFYTLLEDGRLATPTGPLDFPKVTWIGATTDVGLLPEALSNRFPIKPRLAPYTADELTAIARTNARALALSYEPGVCELFAGASRGVPRQVNDYMRAARGLTGVGSVTTGLACEVVEDLNGTTLDGLTDSMQAVLRHIYLYGRRETRDGVSYSASAGALATAAGHGRDTKAINVLVEPYLIQRGLLEVRPSGRTLTPAGVERARQLTGG